MGDADCPRWSRCKLGEVISGALKVRPENGGGFKIIRFGLSSVSATHSLDQPGSHTRTLPQGS